MRHKKSIPKAPIVKTARTSAAKVRALAAINRVRRKQAKSLSSAARAEGTSVRTIRRLLPAALLPSRRGGRVRVKAGDSYSAPVEILTDLGPLRVTARGSRERDLAGRHRAIAMRVLRRQALPSALDQFQGKKVGGHDLIHDFDQLSVQGKITPSNVVGGGSFNLVIDTSSVPKTIVASGTWKAKSLKSFTLIGTYGALGAGILEMNVDLVPDRGPVVEATLRVVCDLAAAGLDTGEEEGFVLDIPGTPFSLGGTFGPFEPYHPVPGGPTNGLSVFNPLNEDTD